MRHRLLALTAAMTATLGLSSTALAASRVGVVLTADSHRHVVQIVDANHVVRAYHYRRLHGVRRGSRIAFHTSGSNIKDVRMVARAATVSFYAKVVSDGSRGLTLRLADGQKLGFTSSQLRHIKATAPSKHAANIRTAVTTTPTSVIAGNVTINIDGLRPGDTVLITEASGGSGALTITIQLTAGPGGATVSASQSSGVVANVGTDDFDVTTVDGSTLHLHLAADALANLNLSVCDNVTVSYHQDAGMFIADSVTDTGASTSGACSPGDVSQSDVLGTIVAVSGASITIDAGDQGSMTFTVSDPSITSAFQIGDSVDVTYEQAALGSTLIADDVEYTDQPTSGVVTSVGSNTVSIVDDTTGNGETFSADPSLLAGVQVGDEVEVSYYQSAGGQVLDQLNDDGPADTGSGSGNSGSGNSGNGGPDASGS
jgi:Cu/Ag efflux protein CusF